MVGASFAAEREARAPRSNESVLHATAGIVGQRGTTRQRPHTRNVTAAFYAAIVTVVALLASSPVAAQFTCTTTATDNTCTNSGTAPALFPNVTPTAGANPNQNATTINSGTANGFFSETQAGGNATSNNSGINAGGILAQTDAGGNATVNNSGTNTGSMQAFTLGGGNVAVNNSGLNDGILATTATSGTVTVNNSGTNTNGISVTTIADGASVTVNNSGSNTGGLALSTNGAGATIAVNNSGSTDAMLLTTFGAGANITVINSGIASDQISPTTGGAADITVINSGKALGTTVISGGNATVINSGTLTNGIAITANNNATVTNSGKTQNVAVLATLGNVTLTNLGVINNFPGNAITLATGTATALDTLTNVVGSRVMGSIDLAVHKDVVNFVGGNWLFTFNTLANATINTNGAPFAVVGNTVAVLDVTSFALADRALVNFTGGVAQMLQGRFGGMAVAAGGPGALGFAPDRSEVAGQAQAAFAGIPAVSMSYASDSSSRPVLGKARASSNDAPAAAAAYADTTVWASGFGGERKQRADGAVLPATDTAYGGALGVDRAVSTNLRLGAFGGAGASSEKIQSDVQSIDATYAFGGVYGRYDWITQYLDFALYGGRFMGSKSALGFAINTVASGFETASMNYGGWFISPQATYGYRIAMKDVTVTPQLRVRYIGGALDASSTDTASAFGLMVGRRPINDLEERAEVELATVQRVGAGALKATLNVGAVGLERLGNPTINAALLGQNLTFGTPGRANAMGGVLGAGLQYRPLPNVSLFVSGEGAAMNDKSTSVAGTGGARISF